MLIHFDKTNVDRTVDLMQRAVEHERNGTDLMLNNVKVVFNMRFYNSHEESCGSAACLGGHIVLGFSLPYCMDEGTGGTAARFLLSRDTDRDYDEMTYLRAALFEPDIMMDYHLVRAHHALEVMQFIQANVDRPVDHEEIETMWRNVTDFVADKEGPMPRSSKTERRDEP